MSTECKEILVSYYKTRLVATCQDKALNVALCFHILYNSVSTARFLNCHSACLTFPRYATDRSFKGSCPKSFCKGPNTCKQFLRHRHIYVPGSHMLRTFKEGSLVCVATRVLAEWSAVRIPLWGNRFALFLTCPNLLGPTLLSIQWVPGVKQTGREVDGSRTSGAEV